MNQLQIYKNEKKISMLILDMDHKLLANIKYYFKKKKIKCITKELNVDKKLENELPDILIIDTSMLTKQQEEFVKNLNRTSRFNHIPKIFLTIKGLTEDRINGYKSGCDAYLSKPFDPEELEAIINNVIIQGKNRSSWILETYLKIKKIRLDFLESTVSNYRLKIYVTKQENEILKKILDGKTNSEIAYDLQTTKRNVERHISRLLNKTNSKTRLELKQLN